MKAQIDICHAYLIAFGTLSPMYRQVYGEDGKHEPSSTELSILREAIQQGHDSPQVLATYLRVVKETVAWAVVHQSSI